MNGQELLNQYTSKRDFSGDIHDQYAQLLMTIFSSIGANIYPLLEKADKSGKSLSVKGEPDEITTDDIILI